VICGAYNAEYVADLVMEFALGVSRFGVTFGDLELAEAEFKILLDNGV
jgi:hypothetical protein